MENIIRLILSNLSITLLALSILIPVFSIMFQRVKLTAIQKADLFLRYVLLLPVGIGALYAFLGHAFHAEYIAHFIGWQTSPFQFEVAVANLGIGVAGVLAFRSTLGFKAGLITVMSCFSLGAAYGHIQEIIQLHNYAPGNAGTVLYLDILLPILCLGLLFFIKFKQNN